MSQGNLQLEIVGLLLMYSMEWYVTLVLRFFVCETFYRVFSQSTFILFHWIKGSPDDTGQGEYNGLTLFEQIDAGVPYTQTKKFLMLMPALITWVACHTAEYKSVYVVVNLGMFLIQIIAKIPEMHR